VRRSEAKPSRAAVEAPDLSLATENGKATRTAAEWVEGFAEGWRAPTDADSFSDHFEPLLGDEMRLVQPQMPDRVGKRAFREEFARPLFSLLQDVRGTVGSWAATEKGDDTILFVELEIRARLAGGRPVTLRTTDRITLRSGVAVERIANLDPLELLGPVALSPRAWPAFLRARFGR
jgi:hypothetical protein